jgi:hypothetical protein
MDCTEPDDAPTRVPVAPGIRGSTFTIIVVLAPNHPICRGRSSVGPRLLSPTAVKYRSASASVVVTDGAANVNPAVAFVCPPNTSNTAL